MDPLVSVIVPVYNVEAYLVLCMSSILAQSLRNIEVILVDDGSLDRCPSMCDGYAAMDDRVKVVHKKNEGLGYARNTGLEYAKGRWILFVDSDDCIALNTLSVCVDIAERENADQVRFLAKEFCEDIELATVDVRDSDSIRTIEIYPDKMMPMLCDIATIHGNIPAISSAWSALYRREAIMRSGVRFHSERELISEDYAFNIEFAAVSGAIAYTSYPFYFYRVNPMSLSKMYKPDRVERCSAFSRYLRTRLQQFGYTDAGFIAAANMIGNLRSHLRHVYASDFSFAEKRRLHYEAVNHPYVREIAAQGEYRRLPLLQRVSFVCRNSYILSRILTDGRAWMKARLKK